MSYYSCIPSSLCMCGDGPPLIDHVYLHVCGYLQHHGPDLKPLIATSSCRETAWPQRLTAAEISWVQIALEAMALWMHHRCNHVFDFNSSLLSVGTEASFGECCTYSVWHPQQGHILRQMLRSIIHIFIQRQHTKRLHKTFCLCLLGIRRYVNY